jgi:splicing factor U2AF 35 kDa subunit
VCDNIGDHLIGNVYAKFYEETDADKALRSLNGRYYAGRPIKGEFSPVTDFKESRCRLFVEGSCDSKYIDSIKEVDTVISCT